MAKQQPAPASDDFRIVVENVSRTNKSTGFVAAEALIKMGPLPASFLDLYTPKNPEPEDKYTVFFKLTKEQRDKFIAALVPMGVELAAAKGLPTTEKEVEAVLRKKTAEIEEGCGEYKLFIDQKKVIEKDGEQIQMSVGVFGPESDEEGKPLPLENTRLSRGSECLVNFLMVATQNQTTKKLNLPFRLQAVRVVKPVFYEGSGTPKRNFNDFSGIDSSY